MPEPTVKGYARETAIATSILAGIAVLSALFLGRVVFMPIVLALTLTTVFRPAVRFLTRFRIPTVAAAPIVILAAMVLAGLGIRLLASSVSQFTKEIPKAAADAKTKLAALPRPLSSLAQAIPDMGAVTGAPADSTTTSKRDTTGRGGDTTTSRVAPKPVGVHGPVPTRQEGKSEASSSPSMGPFVARVFGTAAELVTDFLQTALLLVFLLAGSDTWRKKLTGGRGHPFARALVEIGDEAQSCVSRYIVMTALINLGQGTLVALAAWGLGLPSPVIWGVLTFFAEFLPYLGGIAMVALLLVVGLATSQGVGHALLAPAAYLLVTTLQNNIVSPIVYGRGLELNPAAILVSVILWFFLWGVAGAFLAVPILAIMKIVCDRVGGSLDPVGALIGG